MTARTVENWEGGKGQPGADQLAAIARLTGKALDYFFRAA